MLGVESNKFRMRNRLINSFLYYPIDFLLKLPVCVCVCVRVLVEMIWLFLLFSVHGTRLSLTYLFNVISYNKMFFNLNWTKK